MLRRGLVIWAMVFLLVVADSYMIAKPNLIGRLGIWIYKYHYLRTFPKALLTVSIVVIIAIVIALAIYFLVKKSLIKRSIGNLLLSFFILICSVLLINVIITFSKGSYGHTGKLFRAGANLLPCILIFIFGYGIFEIKRIKKAKQLDMLKPIDPLQETHDTHVDT